jgi:transcriptional regulator with XRE-family HTH domain
VTIRSLRHNLRPGLHAAVSHATGDDARKTQAITQVQLAEMLGVAQQTMAHYEGGTVRIPVETLAQLAQHLQTSVETLIGTQTAKAKGKRGPASKLEQQLEQVHRLPKAQQKFVSQMLDTVLQQAPH